MKIEYSWQICSRCLCEVASGESGRTQTSEFVDWPKHDTDTTELSVAEMFDAKTYRAGIHLVMGADEYGFCHSNCDRCGGLADDRFELVGLTDTTPAGELAEIMKHYIAAAFWTTVDDSHDDYNPATGGGPYLEENFDYADVANVDVIAEELRRFIMSTRLGDLDGLTSESIGHDFWLTRNGHGTGFWDRGLGDVGDRLSKRAEGAGTSDAYVGDDGRIHFS